MERPTPGSRRIADLLLDDDSSEVWLQAWGDANTIARALKTIEEKHPDLMADVSKKAKLFLIANQDNTCDEYILKKWPDALLIQSNAFGAIAYRWQNIMTPEQQEHFDADWMQTNILEVTDDGKPPLTAYRRIIIGVNGQPVKAPPDAGSDPVYLRTMITKLAGPPRESGR